MKEVDPCLSPLRILQSILPIYHHPSDEQPIPIPLSYLLNSWFILLMISRAVFPIIFRSTDSSVYPVCVIYLVYQGSIYFFGRGKNPKNV